MSTTGTIPPVSLTDSGFGMDSNPFADDAGPMEMEITHVPVKELDANLDSITTDVNSDATFLAPVPEPSIDAPPEEESHQSETPAPQKPTPEDQEKKYKEYREELLKIKQEGNKLFQAKQYDDAIQKYQRGLEMCDMIFKGNRNLVRDNAWIADSLSEEQLDTLKDKLQWYTMKDVQPDHPDLADLLPEEKIHVLRDAVRRNAQEIKDNNDYKLAVWQNSALCFKNLKQFQNARRFCDAALELDPKSIKAYLIRAKCYQSIGEYDMAKKDSEMMLQIEPQSKPAQDYARQLEKDLKVQKRKERNSFRGILNTPVEEPAPVKSTRAKTITTSAASSSSSVGRSTLTSVTTASTSSSRSWVGYAIGVTALAAVGFLGFQWMRRRSSSSAQ